MKTIASLIGAGALAGFMLVAASPVRAADVDKKTVRLYKAKCASCHGEDGKGQTEQGKKMAVRDWTTAAYWKETNDQKIKDSMVKGINQTTKDGKKQQMDSYTGKLTPEQIDALVAYVKTFKK